MTSLVYFTQVCSVHNFTPHKLISGLGQVSALMGPSGAGKVVKRISYYDMSVINNLYCFWQTTLLNLLAGHLPSRSMLHGHLEVDGNEVPLCKARKFGFVAQDDLLLPNLTVVCQIAFK